MTTQASELARLSGDNVTTPVPEDYETKDRDDENESPKNCKEFLKDLFRKENDLAGFNIIWGIGFVVLVILKIINHPEVAAAAVETIILLPPIISITTWIFSYAIYSNRAKNAEEAMNKRRFLIPLITKMILTTTFFGLYSFGKDGLLHRYIHNTDIWTHWCLWSIIAQFIAYFLATLTTEIMITTVMVNSIQNVKNDTKIGWKIFLFIARPTIWIYNRLIVLFMTYYAFWVMFLGIGPVSQSQCAVQAIQTHKLGFTILLQPFNYVLYLFKWDKKHLSWNLNDYDINQGNGTWKYSQTSSTETTLIVIKQTLLSAILIDLLLSLWSVFRLCKKETKAEKQRSVYQDDDDDK